MFIINKTNSINAFIILTRLKVNVASLRLIMKPQRGFTIVL